MKILRAGVLITDPSADPGYLVDGAVLIENGSIVETGSFADLSARHSDLEVIGGPDCVAMPGLINAHDHGRGLSPLELGVPDDLLEIWILSLSLMPSYDVNTDTKLSALRQLKSGISTTVNSYFDPSSNEASVQAVLDGYDAAGIRSGLIFSALDRSTISQLLRIAEQNAQPGLKAELGAHLAKSKPYDVERFKSTLRQFSQMPEGSRNWLMTGPVSAHWSSDELLASIRDMADELGIAMQMHLLESRFQALDNQKFESGSIVRHVDGLGLMNTATSCAHCVQLPEADYEVMADTGASVVHNISSNFRLQNGIAAVPAMLRAGVNVALGLDSAGLNDNADFFFEMRLAYKVHGVLSPKQILTMATVNGAKALGLGEKLGTLAPGKKADIVLLDDTKLWRAGMQDAETVYQRIINYATPDKVKAVLVDGEVVIEAGKHATLDEAELVARLYEDVARSRQTPKSGMPAMLPRIIPLIREHMTAAL